MFFLEIQEKFLYLPIFKQNQWFCLQGNISFSLKMQNIFISKHTITYLCHTKPLGEVSKNLFLITCFALL